ncbi:uncharacterized protein BX664DRAFT_323461 [Halteromyces radiatus]|uniref:uncharacterized protein n=1 Tax=Halteromyces radiatus TaxID=101107 RepID=UPI00221ECC52|nr:uncharacterized protein BX664DRAFT_323461 [Halteromyces radiatus]KAI8096251.1 hypothetical protein BX664DRAFT_323461 [Halteromyces radiatus]
MFRHRIKSPITEDSSFQSGKASIIGMRESSSLEQQHDIDYTNKPPAPDYTNKPAAPPPPPLKRVPTSTSSTEPLTIESMSAVIAAAVQMSANQGVKSSLSMGHASIKPIDKKKKEDEQSKRRFSLFTWKKQQEEESQEEASVSSSSSLSSPRSSSSQVDDGLDELSYRGIQIKEIKTTLKPMVIPANVTNPMPTVKLERPGFARINY